MSARYVVRLWIDIKADSPEDARQQVLDEIHNTDWVPKEWNVSIDNTEEVLRYEKA